MTAPMFSASLGHTLLSQSPAHAKAALEQPDEPSTVMDLGAVAHELWLMGEASVCVISAPDWRTKVAKQARDAARLAGEIPVLTHQWEAVRTMVAAGIEQVAKCEPPIPFTNGIPERSIFWNEAGVECRATPDWLSRDYRLIEDLKTVSTSAHPAVFSRTLWDKGYHLQSALYRRAVKRVYGVDADFRFVVIETEPPHALSVVALDPEATEFADQQLDTALAIWKRCLEAGEFPGYPTRACYAEAPAYLKAQWETRSYYDALLVQTS
jgi:hypothetical protein